MPASAQVPMVDGHSISTALVRGSLRDMRVVGTELVCRAYFASDPESDRVWQLYRDGHLTDFSVGGQRLAVTTLRPGDEAVVGGTTYRAGTVPLRIVTKWRPVEGTTTPIGADPAATTRSQTTPQAAAIARTTDKDTPMNFAAWLAARGIAINSLTDVQRAALQADFDAIQRATAQPSVAAGTPAAQPAAGVQPAAPAHVEQVVQRAAQPVAIDESERSRIIRAERERTQQIREVCGTDVNGEFIARAVDEGWDLARTRTEVLAEIRRARGNGDRTQAGSTGVHVEVVAANEDKFVRAAETALLLRGGRVPVTDQARLAEAVHLRGASVQDIARAACAAHRIAAPINPDALLRAAVSTFSFPTALGNTLYRSLLGGLRGDPVLDPALGHQAVVNDFREHKHIKLGKFGRPEKVGKGGEIKHGNIKEEADGYSAETYGQEFLFSRVDFVNDDAGMFDRIPYELGASMRMNIDDVGYDLLVSAAGVGPTLDTAAPGDAAAKALFATDRADGANYIASAVTLSSAGLTALKLLMRKIKNNGRLLNLVPKFLIVPAALEQTALELVKASTLYGSSTSDAGKPNVNTWQGALEVIVEPRLDAGTNGGTAFYLVCDQVQAKSIGIAFLRGQENPAVERMVLNTPLAMGWMAYHDVGADAIDWRGAARSKGA
jgi:hypothetical protein